jgi:Sigma-70, region 4/Bacterial RNA polymerase, alpha chain C terminal domain
MDESTFPLAGGSELAQAAAAARATSSDSNVALAAMSEKLGAPIDALRLPTRMVNYANTKALTTVADLVRLAPEALLLERNLGRTSIADTEARIREYLGVPWHAARAYLLERDEQGAAMIGVTAAEAPAATVQAPPWRALQDSVTSQDRALPLGYLRLPSRLASFAYHQGLKTVGDLLSWSEGELLSAENLGRGSIAKGAEVIAQTLAARAEAEVHGAQNGLLHFADFMQRSIGELSSQERLILTQRSGLVSPTQTLAQVGELLGVTRERVRQLEAKAYAELAQQAKLHGHCERIADALQTFGLVTPVRELGLRGVAELSATEEQSTLLGTYLSDVLQSEYRVTTLWGEPLLTRHSDAALAAKLQTLEGAARACVYPAASEGFSALLAQRAGMPIEEVHSLRPFLPFPFEIHSEVGKADMVLGLAGNRQDAILAHLRLAKGPVPVTELEARFGRSNLPRELVWVRHGTVTLPEVIDGYATWLERIGPLTESILAVAGPSRQWSTLELLPLLEEKADLPEWVNAWTLGSLYKHADNGFGPVAYLGRNVIGLRGAEDTKNEQDDAGKRMHLAPLTEQILAEAGMPCAEEDVRQRVLAVRGLNAGTWNLLRTRAPFVLFGDGRMGLAPRDYPFSEEATARLLTAFRQALGLRQRGMNVREQREWLAGYTDSVSVALLGSAWDARAFRSLVRHDKRFRSNIAGGIGLREWESARTETQGETLSRLLTEGGGRVAVATLEQELTGRDGELRLSAQWGLLAAKVGARLEGDTVVRRQVPELATHAAQAHAPSERDDAGDDAGGLALGPRAKRVLSEVPARTAQLLQAMMQEAVQGTRTLPSALDMLFWHRVMQAHLGYYVEAEQLARVTELAEKVQSAGANAAQRCDAECTCLATAALGYLLEQDDAKNDTALGGLDDDEAVLRVVWGELEGVVREEGRDATF